MIGENKIQKKKTKGIKCVRRKKNKNDRKRKEHRINEDSKDPIMEETYITLTMTDWRSWKTFVVQPTNNKHILNTAVCVYER